MGETHLFEKVYSYCRHMGVSTNMIAASGFAFAWLSKNAKRLFGVSLHLYTSVEIRRLRVHRVIYTASPF